MAFGDGHDLAEGQRLFDLGNTAAADYRHSDALEFYAKSIAACPSPAPHINRARIFVQRIRYVEALAELAEASRLEIIRGGELSAVLKDELDWVRSVLRNRNSKAVDDLIRIEGREEHRKTAESLIFRALDVPSLSWEYGSLGGKRGLVEYHLFSEMNNIAIYDEIELYPEVKELHDTYGVEFIRDKVSRCPDVSAYREKLLELHRCLSSFEIDSMRLIRRFMHYDIHRVLLTMDYGPMFETYSSDCNGRICEANEFYLRGRVCEGRHDA